MRFFRRPGPSAPINQINALASRRVKKSTKAKSKRTSQKDRWKVQKKVREHYKKQRRDAKRKKAQGIRPRKPKDPGVPASWPFRQELQQEMELHRQHTKALNQARRARSSQQQQRAQPHDGQDGLYEESESLAELSRQAQRRADAYAAVERAAAGSRNKSGSAATRAYFKEFRKVVQSADIVLHVLDARDPSACRCEDVERYVQRNNPDRRVVLVLNKADLVPREALQQWLARLREEAPAVAFKAAISKSGDSKPARGGSNRPTESLKSEECLGAQTLLQLLKNFARKQGGTGKLIAGVVGLPNVGKSSLINSMKLSKAVHTAAEPGSTKTMQHVNIDSSISLLDSPGVVTSSPNEGEAAAALRNAHAIDSLEDPITPVREIVRRCPAHQLMHVYSVPTFESADDFLRLVAAQRGKLKKGGVPNTAEAGRIVLKDWRNGTIPYYTLPPKKHFDELPYEDAQVVQSYSAEFSAEDVYRNEGTLVIDKLPTKSERADSQLMAQMSAGSKPTLDVDNLEQQVQAEQAVGEHQTRFRTNTSRANASDNDEQTQSELLYTESGQYNPHLARAAKKRAKKARAAGAVQSNVTSVDEEPDEDMEEYDFGALGGGRRDEDEDGNVIVVDESNDDGADKSDEELDGDEEADDEQMG